MPRPKNFDKTAIDMRFRKNKNGHNIIPREIFNELKEELETLQKNVIKNGDMNDYDQEFQDRIFEIQEVLMLCDIEEEK